MAVVGQHFESSDAASPADKIGALSKFVELAPKDSAGFLENVVGIEGTQHLGADIGVDLPLAIGIQSHELVGFRVIAHSQPP